MGGPTFSPPTAETLTLINPQLLEILRCPNDHSELSPAEPALIAKANRSIAAGALVNLAGQKIEREFDGGLVRATGDLMYPVVDEIPVMLPDEAIELSQLADVE